MWQAWLVRNKNKPTKFSDLTLTLYWSNTPIVHFDRTAIDVWLEKLHKMHDRMAHKANTCPYTKPQTLEHKQHDEFLVKSLAEFLDAVEVVECTLSVNSPTMKESIL